MKYHSGLAFLLAALAALPAFADGDGDEPPPWIPPEPPTLPAFDFVNDNVLENLNDLNNVLDLTVYGTSESSVDNNNRNDNTATGGSNSLTIIDENPRVRFNLGASGGGGYTQITAQCVGPPAPKLKKNGQPRSGFFNRGYNLLGLFRVDQKVLVDSACVARIEAAAERQERDVRDAHAYRMVLIDLERDKVRLETLRLEVCFECEVSK